LPGIVLASDHVTLSCVAAWIASCSFAAHPRQAQRVDVRMRPVDLRGRVLPLHLLADQLVLGERLQRRPARVRGRERLVAEQCAVGDGLGAVADDRDHARVDPQPGNGHAQLLGGEAEQNGPRLGSGLAYLRTAVRNRVAADRAALVRRDVGVPHCGLDLLDRQVELFGRDHQEAGGRAGDVDLPEGDRGGVVRVDRYPRVDQGRVGRACNRARSSTLRRAGEGRADEAEADDECAAALQELLAVELGTVDQLVQLAAVEQVDRAFAENRHPRYPSFAIVAAARLIALVIRG
jgi:hypothetical protein